jgi:hypothetical protein
MTEEVKEIVEGTEAKEVVKVEHTEAEQRAMESGWVPKDQWEGDPDQWRPAKEFNDRGELFKKMDNQNRTIKELKNALDDMKRHHNSVRETEYARALETLKAQKKTAFEEGNSDLFVSLDDQIDLVKEEQFKLKQAVNQPQTKAEQAPEFVAWVDKNKWYETNEPMRAYADALGRSLASKGMEPNAVLKEVEKQVKEEFPTKFTNPNRAKAGAVEGSSSKGGKGEDSFALSDDERRIMDRFVRTGAITKEKYIADLKSMRS